MPPRVADVQRGGHERERDAGPEEVERPLRGRLRDDAEADRRVEDPRRGLADDVDVELDAARLQDARADEKEHVPADDHGESDPRQPVVVREEDHGGVDHEPVGERVGDLPEMRLDVPAPGEVAVHLVGDAGDPEHDPRRPARIVPGLDHEDDEDGNEHEPRDGERVRQLRERWGHGAASWKRRRRSRRRPAGNPWFGHSSKDTGVPEAVFANAHCHAFQRALGERTGGADFWAWRETMLDLAAQQTPASVRTTYTGVYRELREAGWAAVGEFHYLGLAQAHAAVEAAGEAGIEVVLLHVAYARGGIDRIRQDSVAAYLSELEDLRAAGIRVGVAPHSVRACPRDWLEELGRYAAEHELPLHIHADEQPREIEECLAEHGMRPIELLDACGCLGPRTTVVHATHADGRELDLLAAAGSRVCACPTTEADLADGFLPVERLLHRGIEICVGSDSNVRIDPREELRELDWIARRQSGRRDVFTPEALRAIGTEHGARALGLVA